MTTSNRRSFMATAAAGVLSAGPLLAATRRADKPVRIGQIGTKHGHAGGKVKTLLKYPDLFDVVGIAEPDADQRKRVEKTPSYSGLKWMSLQELLETDGLEAVTVETNVAGLLDAAERCIDAGKHIHLDKPAGDSLPQFRRICEKADKNRLSIQMGYMYRSNPAFRFLFNAVSQGWLGDVFLVNTEMSKKIDDAARAELSEFHGGSMFELGCHLIDATLTVLGIPDRVTAFNRNTRPEFDNLMDNCLAVFEYPKATATVRSSVSEVEGFRRRQFIACGTKGTIAIQPLEPYSLTLTLESDTDEYKAGTQEISLPMYAGRYDRELQHFANVIRGREQPEFSTEHDLAVQKAVLQASDMPIN